MTMSKGITVYTHRYVMIMPKSNRMLSLCLVFPPPEVNNRPVTQIPTLENYHTMKCIQTAHCKQYLSA